MSTKESFLTCPVKKVPCKELKGLKGFDFNSKITHAIIVETPHGPKIVNFCSEDYELVPNVEIMNKVEQLLRDQGYAFERKENHRYFSRFNIDYVLKDSNIAILQKDIVIPRIRFRNSYDGKFKLQANFGFYRVVCSNGLSIPEGKVDTIDLMHTSGIISSATLEDVFHALGDFTARGKKHSESYKQLAGKVYTEERAKERIEQVFNATSFPKRQAENVLETMLREHKQYKIPYSDWLTYNAFNNQLNHNKDIGMEEHKKERVDEAVLTFLLNS